MGKKYSPSGYQIIEIDLSHVDDNGYLIIDNEDSKILYDILSKPILPSKPILLKDVRLPIMGFPVIVPNSLSLNYLSFSEGSLTTASCITINYDDVEDKLLVSFSEI